MAAASAQTALARDYPGIASLSRHELETLLGGDRSGRHDSWSRREPPWYIAQQQQQQRGAGPSAPVAGLPPPEEQVFEAFIDSLPEVQALRQESHRLLQLSEEKAARNAAMQPDLEGLRAETQQLYDRARHCEAQWPQVAAGMGQAYKRFSPSALHSGLMQSASKLHDESESVASAFAEGLPLDVAASVSSAAGGGGGSLAAVAASLQGQSTPESGAATPTRGTFPGESAPASSSGNGAGNDAAFVRRYRALRTVYHRRNLVAERWARGAITWRDD